MSRNLSSVTLHQQGGGMSAGDFAALQGISMSTLRKYLYSGRVVGARQDARSKQWTIYPPARLVDREGDTIPPRTKLQSEADIDEPDYGSRADLMDAADYAGLPGFSLDEAECDSSRAAPPSGAGVMAEALSGHADAHPTPPVPGDAEPLLADQQAPQGRAGGSVVVYRSAATRSVLQSLREAVARQHREGIHYLRLDGFEFAQLYAALGRERRRLRNLVSRGRAAVGELRASDTVWRKLQAMCHEGRLL